MKEIVLENVTAEAGGRVVAEGVCPGLRLPPGGRAGGEHAGGGRRGPPPAPPPPPPRDGAQRILRVSPTPPKPNKPVERTEKGALSPARIRQGPLSNSAVTRSPLFPLCHPTILYRAPHPLPLYVCSPGIIREWPRRVLLSARELLFRARSHARVRAYAAGSLVVAAAAHPPEPGLPGRPPGTELPSQSAARRARGQSLLRPGEPGRPSGDATGRQMPHGAAAAAGRRPLALRLPCGTLWEKVFRAARSGRGIAAEHSESMLC